MDIEYILDCLRKFNESLVYEDYQLYCNCEAEDFVSPFAYNYDQDWYGYNYINDINRSKLLLAMIASISSRYNISCSMSMDEDDGGSFGYLRWALLEASNPIFEKMNMVVDEFDGIEYDTLIFALLKFYDKDILSAYENDIIQGRSPKTIIRQELKDMGYEFIDMKIKKVYQSLEGILEPEDCSFLAVFIGGYILDEDISSEIAELIFPRFINSICIPIHVKRENMEGTLLCIFSFSTTQTPLGCVSGIFNYCSVPFLKDLIKMYGQTIKLGEGGAMNEKLLGNSY